MSQEKEIRLPQSEGLTITQEEEIRPPKREAERTPKNRAPKNIILLSDGTGNNPSKLCRTNVWRLYQALDLSSSTTQIALYDDGVGTSSFKPLALLGGITGWGLKRNVLDLYTFVCRHYNPGDHLYCFGFSRGAFTIRVLAGLINNQGLVQAEQKGELRQLAAEAFRAYREQRYKSWGAWPFRFIRNILLWLWNMLIPGNHIYKALKISAPQPGNAQSNASPSSAPFENVYDANQRNIKPAWFFASPEVGYEASKDKKKVEIEFLGLWDTVAAYGLPFDELVHAWDFIFPLSFPDRSLGSIVNRACHALALDDERHSFHPELWNENPEDYSASENYFIRPLNSRLKQVWFAGMHSNLGGSYPDDGMAHVPLKWIMDEAAEQRDAAGNIIKDGLKFIPIECDRLKAGADVSGKMYDSRRGLSGAYRYLPRKLEDLLNQGVSNQKIEDTLKAHPYRFLPEKIKDWVRKKRKQNRVIIETAKIHESVFNRIHNRVDGYAPIGLPANYEIFPSPTTSGLPLYAEPDSKKRVYRQEKVWNLVWWKRLVYFFTIGIVFLLAILPFTVWKTPWEDKVKLLSPVIKGIGAFVPSFVDKWIEAYQTRPMIFILLVLGLALCLKVGSSFQGRIFDKMRTIFDKKDETAQAEKPKDWLYTLRCWWFYQGFFKVLKRYVIPQAILLLAALFLVRGSVSIMDSYGVFSTPTPTKDLKELKDGELVIKDKPFSNKAVCWASGVKVEEGKRYELKLTINGENQETWRDRQTDSPIGGFGWEAMNWQRVLAYPLRRQLTGRWFKPIARIGDRGTDDYVLEPLGESTDQTLIAEIQARRSGELFLFVDDAVLPLGQGGQISYNNNKGEATLNLKLLP